jgi:hypothetical protein
MPVLKQQTTALIDAKRLAKITQRDRELNSWAIRSFRDVAGGDYIAARLAYRARLPVQFLWASQQTIEKYLKSIVHLADTRDEGKTRPRTGPKID